MKNPIAAYTKARRILLCTLHSLGLETALKYLDETYQKTLESTGYLGLRAELLFYGKFREQYKLTPALDVGDHVDYVGEVDGKMCRIDVGTNLHYKSDLKPYERFLDEGHSYRIAHVDPYNGCLNRLVDVVDLHFPECPSCKGGHLLPIAVLLGENRNTSGESKWSNDQLLLEICGACEEYREKDRITTPFLSTLQTFIHETESRELSKAEVNHHIDTFIGGCLHYLTRAFKSPIVALGDHGYEFTGPKGEGEWRMSLVYRKPYVTELLPDFFPAESSM